MSRSPEQVAGLALPALWATLPFTAGEALAASLGARSDPVGVVAGSGLWGLWALCLVATLVPRTLHLTAVRLVVPAGLPVVAWAVADGGAGGLLDVLGLSAAALATAVVLTPWIGHRFVNGSAYGDERRYLLRAPLALLAGPLVVVWALTVLGAVTGPLLLAAGSWLPGAVAVAVGWPLAALGARAAHGLSRRWLVVVPAGLVVHDPMALVDTLLVQRHDLARVGPAPADTDATDLTLGAPGLAVEIELRDEVDVLPLAHQRGRALTRAGQPAVTTTATALGRTLAVRKVLVTPTTPGAFLRAAAQRRLPVG